MNGYDVAPRPGLTRNPILSGFNPDPTIIRVEDDYFLATSTFEYFPGVPIYHSKNLVEWDLIGHCLNRQSQLDLRAVDPGLGVFAPTLRYHRGRFYMTTVAVHSRPSGPDAFTSTGFFVWTDDIWDPKGWSDPVYLDCLGIDQDLFFDDTTGKVWLSIAKNLENDVPGHKGFSMGVYTAEIDIETGSSLSELELARASTEGNGIAEGPHIFKRGEYYYLICAEGGTEIEHQEWVMRSKDGPLGPWELGERGVVNPMVYNGDHTEIRQTGHMDLVEGADGRWWAVFLAVRPVHVDKGETRLSQLGRETFLAPVEWVDGWPIVNQRRPITINMDMGLPRTSETLREDLSFAPKTDLAKQGWYRMRTPVKVDYSLSERPGSLTLRAGPYPITANEAPTMFLRKQLSFEGVWQVTLDAPSLQSGHSAGVAIWWSKYAFASVSIRGVSGGRELVYRYPEMENNDFKETIHTLETDEPIIFTVQASPTSYNFSYALSSEPQKTHHIAVFSSALLVRTRSFDSIFTGTHFALWASGARNQGSLFPVHFSDMSYEGVRAGGR